jgi:nitroreductase
MGAGIRKVCALPGMRHHDFGTCAAIAGHMDPGNAERLQYLIEARHSSRAPFDPAWRVNQHELSRIVDAARWAPTAHNMQNFRLVVVDDPRTLEELGRIRAMASPAFIAESDRQLSSSVEELERRGVGLLATSFPSSWWTPDPARAPADASRSLGELIAGAPMVVIVVFDATQRAPASGGDVLGMISLGCVLENMWLTVQVLKLDVQVLSAFAGEAAEPEIKRALGIPLPWRIAYALRLGHACARTSAPRVRRDPETFVDHNRFR